MAKPFPYIVNLVEAPTFIKTLTIADETVILIHKVKKKVVDSSELSKTVVDDNESRLDLTGSPLRVDLNETSVLLPEVGLDRPNWTRQEETYCPLSVEEARSFLSNSSNYSEVADCDNVSVWCICDGQDKNHVVLLSQYKSNDRFITKIGSFKGRFTRNDPIMTIDAMHKLHFSYAKSLNKKIGIKTCAIYNIYKSKLVEPLLDDDQGSITLEVTWDKSTYDIFYPHCDSKMNIQTVVGHSELPSNPLWEQLLILHNLITGLQNEDNIFKSTTDQTFQSESLVESITDALHNFQITENGVKGTGFVSTIKAALFRNDEDLTDRLWKILMDCKSYSELITCLDAVFSEAVDEELDLNLADENTSMMAKLLRGIHEGVLSVPSLKGNEPIELLIGIGLQKLIADYSHIFLQNNFLTRKELEELFMRETFTKFEPKKSGKRSSAPLRYSEYLNLNQAEKLLNRLAQLHVVIDVFSLTEFHCCLSEDTLKSLANVAIKKFVGTASTCEFSKLRCYPLVELSVSVPTPDVKTVVQCLPHVWSLTYTSSQGNHTVASQFYHSLSPIFPPSMCPKEENFELEDSEDGCYYYTHLLTIDRNL